MNTYLVAVHFQHDVGVSHRMGYSQVADTVSRNRSLFVGGGSSLISGRCLWYSLSVGMTVFNSGGRTVSRKHGAFSLCTPSLGFLFTKWLLRCLLLGQPNHMIKVRTLWVDLYKIYKVIT